MGTFKSNEQVCWTVLLLHVLCWYMHCAPNNLTSVLARLTDKSAEWCLYNFIYMCLCKDYIFFSQHRLQVVIIFSNSFSQGSFIFIRNLTKIMMTVHWYFNWLSKLSTLLYLFYFNSKLLSWFKILNLNQVDALFSNNKNYIFCPDLNDCLLYTTWQVHGFDYCVMYHYSLCASQLSTPLS